MKPNKKYTTADDVMSQIASAPDTQSDEPVVESTEKEEIIGQEAVETSEDVNLETPAPTESVVEDEETEESPVVLEEDGDTSGEETDEADETDEDTLFEDWDISEEPEDQQDEAIDFAKLGKDLGIRDDIGSQKDIKDYIDKLSSEVSDLKSQPRDDFSSVPAELRKAIDLAKEGGDYLSFLQAKTSELDYTKIDPRALYEEEVRVQCFNKDGTFDQDRYDDYMDSMPDVQIELFGKQLQSQRIAEQQSMQAQLERDATVKREKDLASLRQALKEIDNVGGFKLTQKHKDELYQGISSGATLKRLFQNDKGEYDFEKTVKGCFIMENFDKINNFHRTRAHTSAKRDMLNELTNPQVNRPGELPTPTTEKKLEGMDAWIDQLKNQK